MPLELPVSNVTILSITLQLPIMILGASFDRNMLIIQATNESKLKYQVKSDMMNANYLLT